MLIINLIFLNPKVAHSDQDQTSLIISTEYHNYLIILFINISSPLVILLYIFLLLKIL